MVKKILLLDVSHLFFRAFYAFPRNLTDSEKNPINAVFGVAQMLMTVLEKRCPDIVLGGKDLPSPTLRSKQLESYKGNRPELDDDLRQQIPRIYEFLEAFGVPVFSEEGYEADDMIASLAEKYRGDERYQIEILTGDADAFQLIGDNIVVLKPLKGGEVEVIDREVLFEKKSLYPEEIIDFKGMAGDGSDNLKGVEGIGEKGAVGLIRLYGNLEQIYEAWSRGEIKGAKAKRLEEGREDAFFTRDMARLYRTRECSEEKIKQGSVQSFSVEGACQFFESIGSQSLQTRIKNLFPLGNVELVDVENPENVKESQSALF